MTSRDAETVEGNQWTHVNDPSDATQHGEVPAACTLGSDDGRARLQRWQHLHQIAAPTAQLNDGQLEIRYQPAPDVLNELQGLVADERVCCSFVSWAVTEESGQPVLRVTASPSSPDDIKPIAAMFATT